MILKNIVVVKMKKITQSKINKLKESYLKERGFKKAKGYAIDTNEMNPEEYDEIYFEGESLEKSIKEYWRKIEFWIYEPSEGEQVFEDIDDAIEYAEEISDVTFDKYKTENR